MRCLFPALYIRQQQPQKHLHSLENNTFLFQPLKGYYLYSKSLSFLHYADDIDVTITSHSSNINYYSNGTKCFSRRGSWEPNLEFNSLNLQFEEAETYQSSTTTDKAYALDGHVKVSVKLESGVESRIKYIKVAALYGHTTIGADFPSISLSVPASISIGFSGNLSIDSIASAQAKIEIGSSSSRPVVTDLLDN